jgi:hypothetical protein
MQILLACHHVLYCYCYAMLCYVMSVPCCAVTTLTNHTVSVLIMQGALVLSGLINWA